MSKTAREKNTAYNARQQDRIRPQPAQYDFATLQQVVNTWIKRDVQA